MVLQVVWFVYAYPILYVCVFLFSFQDSSMEKFYLKIDGQNVCTVTFITDNPNTIVHKKPSEDGREKFLLNTIFASCALNWDSYDADIHCPVSYFSENIKGTRKFQSKHKMEIKTANIAKGLNGAKEEEKGRKRKHDPSNSKAAIQKQRRNRG